MRFLQAIDRARSITDAALKGSVRITAVVSHYGAERRSRRDVVSFKQLWQIGFDNPFGPPENIPQRDENHITEFGEDLYRGLALQVYDDRRMEIVATRANHLEPLQAQFSSWLLENDRAAMDIDFGRVC